MLISRLSEGEARGEERDAGEYQTADELFEIMAKDRNYDTSDKQSLSTRDLIILYKNIDVGTKLMSNVNIGHRKTPNQHVETIVYKDEKESDDSDVSEIYSNEDLHDIFSINNERINFINNISSIQHPLCHKFGDIEIQPSNFTSEYDSHFLFKDPYIKKQLKNINILPDSMGFGTMLPASLLDYICCKRLEDNYNFYMDNVIRYVQHTIEQLKRISNGDFLTDRAKEKWREVAKDLAVPSSDATKVLATSVSIPIHVMGKVDGHRSTWDDIVHSEVDVRSLSKILEKKIIIEVPKLICGSYRLFSERCADNLIISCKKNVLPDVDQDKEESRVDVVFQLKPSGSGHVISNINSIMILQKIPSITTAESNGDLQKEIAFENCNESFEQHSKIVEITEHDYKEKTIDVVVDTGDENSPLNVAIKKSILDTSDCPSESLQNNYYLSSSQSNIVDKGPSNKKVSIKTLKAETDFTLLSPDELRCAIRKLNMQTPLLEESEESTVSKKKSPTRVRIKSPYENQSYSIEEKKRKKLLEIREKREKKKIALSENCKITKHKYGKGVVMAQPSSSVTKLSITNKSFYNSIYGENINQEGGTSKKPHKSQKNHTSEQAQRKDESEIGHLKSSFTTLERTFFDDETTETVMHLQQKLDTETYPNPISAMSNYDTDVNLLSHLIGSTETDSSSDDDSSPMRETRRLYRDQDNVKEVHEADHDTKDTVTCQSSCILVPANTPKEKETSNKQQDEIRKTTTSVECRKSIDKIYDLLKKLGKHDNEMTNSTTQYVSNNTDDMNIDGRRSSTIQISDSGTSVKHHIISSNPSTFSFEKNTNINRQKDKKKKEPPATVVPKVIISTKLQTSKIDAEWNKIDRKRVETSPTPKVPDNPLKAISQLLHEFNNVQKTRHKTNKKIDNVLADGKAGSRQGSSKKPRQEQSSKDAAPLKSLLYKEKKPRPIHPPELAHFPHQNTYGDDKHMNRVPRKNLSDIIDEAKEARGEAIRGPSKPYSRINTLAQPKKAYIQAHNDEYQIKYGRNITSNRLQRVTTSAPVVDKTTNNTNYTRNRRKGPETASMSSAKPGIPAVSPLERMVRPRRSASNSPTRKRVPQLTIEPPFRQINAPKSPDLKKKMVAVESYVKSHYGQVPIDTSELKGHEVHKSRVPLIPNDIELASLTSSPTAEESTALGNQLHYMVDSMINTNAPVLSILTECKESTSKLSDGLNELSTDSLIKIDEGKSDSDYPVDIFKDKSILTAVASIPKEKIKEDKVVDENIDTIDTYDVQTFNSATEIRKLENALYQRMSVGAFPKRLRIKNLTLTPKQSLQQVIVVQSGDAGSLLVKSSLSHSLRSDSKTNSLTALKPLAALSNTHMNWGFTNIPLQVATIGYAFPAVTKNTLPPCIRTLIDNSNENVSKNTYKSHKTSQCFKGVHKESGTEQATQANIVISTPSSYNLNTNPIQSQCNMKESVINKGCKNLQPVNKIGKISSIIEKRERVQPIIQKYERLQAISKKYEKTNNIEILIGESEKLKERTEQTEKLEQITEQCEKVEQIEQSERVEKTKQCEKIHPTTEKSNRNEEITTLSKKYLNNDEEKGELERKPSETIDHSTSLDILMGLLNEIRKITSESVNKNIDVNHVQDNQCNELEIILNNAVIHESSLENSSRDLISVSSLDKFDQFHSNPSISSFSILNMLDKENKGAIEILKDFPIDCNQPKNVDKEVAVAIEKQYVDKLTDAPSCLFPLTMNHGTKIADSGNDILTIPLTRSIYSLAKYKTLNCTLAVDSALDQPRTENIKNTYNEGNTMETQNCNILNDEDENIHKEQSANVKVETLIAVSNSYTPASKITRSYVTVGSEFDPLMKIKRDILVTVYSILVLIVFAALSFPKVFFYIEM